MNSQVDVLSLWNTLAVDLGGLARAASAESPDWGQLELVLDCLPLGTGEHARCRNQLHNARVYYTTGESGAGAYELTQLVRRLRQVMA